MKNTLVLAHGAFHGPWCWQPLMTRLEERGLRCVAVDLDRGGLEADRQILQGEVDRLRAAGCRVSAIGHSLGCTSTALLDPETIESAVFLAGPVVGPGMPDIGGCVSPDFTSALVPQPDGRVMIPLERAREIFYHRCPTEAADAAIAQLRPTFIYGAKPGAEPIWESIPSTYIECTDDRAVLPEFQHASAAVMAFSASLDSDHSPMLGEPDLLAEIVMKAIGRADG